MNAWYVSAGLVISDLRTDVIKTRKDSTGGRLRYD
jgi:hypothetical protein